MQMTVFVPGLEQKYNKEAYNELNRQKGDSDMEALRHTLIRFATFEKSQRDMSRLTMQEARPERPKQGQPQTSERTASNERPPWKYTGVIYGHCQKRHRTDECWLLHPEKRSQNRKGYPQRETTEKEVDTRVKANSAVAASAHACDWLLDSAASFHMTKERPKDTDEARGGEKVIAAIGEVIKSIRIGQVSVGQMSLKDVRFVPRLDRNLMSISALAEDGWKLVFEKGRVVVSKEGQSMTVREAGGVYTVTEASLTSIDSLTASTLSSRSSRFISASKWLPERFLHRRIGHLNQEYVRQLLKAVK
jgi:hypothetical protein